MAVAPPAKTLDLDLFWRLYSRYVGRLMRENAHAEVTLIMRDGIIQQVRVAQNYLPSALPDPRP